MSADASVPVPGLVNGAARKGPAANEVAATCSTTIRIVIVDDHAMVRAGLRMFLGSEHDFVVVAEAADGRAALDLVRQGGFDVMLLDISMPGPSGVDTLLAIRARDAALPVLMLSGFPEHAYATMLLRQGASGYLSKDCAPADLATAIRTVHRGRKYITPAVAERLAEGLGQGGDGPPHEHLSDRELQVFLRLARGETLGQTAAGLCLSVKTVSTYRSRVMEKMRLASNSDLTHYALTRGLISGAARTSAPSSAGDGASPSRRCISAFTTP